MKRYKPLKETGVEGKALPKKVGIKWKQRGSLCSPFVFLWKIKRCKKCSKAKSCFMLGEINFFLHKRG
ncbi:hypothetical protein CKF48_09390 [Cytobacillus kochii]|uniref:Uncharacterized protein n=1 Tax=Cytobacillus kochii TaxID=859143 RepID=A0A248TH42_9BACI|nr:hypothetical protein CKF48_09390 [Cytobacillus kochii]